VIRGGARRTLAVAVVVALPGIVLPMLGVGCRETANNRQRTGDDASRAAVLQFWEALNRATEARRAGDYAAAARAYEEALAVDPRHEDALYYLGNCRREEGKQTEARDAFARLTAVNPHSSRGHVALGAILVSPVDGSAPDLRAAERNFRRAHDINKEETGSMLRLGEVLLVRGDLAGADHWFRAALKTNPKSVEAAFLIGYLRWQAGDRAAALEAYARAIRAATADAPVKGVLGEGDRKAAASGPTSPGTPAGGPVAPVAPAGVPDRIVAPPLANPHGETLFSDLAAPLRKPGNPDAANLAHEDLDRVYHPLRGRLQAIRARASSGGGEGPAG